MSSFEDEDNFKRLLGECGRDVTLFLKRLRKTASAPIKYLVVSERHKSGVPHFHILVHEQRPNAVTHANLKHAWQAGFSHFKLADPKAAGYVAKYISKDALARVRASEHYGESSFSELSFSNATQRSADMRET